MPLDQPHTASVRAVTDAKVHVIEDASQFLSANPNTLLPIATLLARRLQSATTYLVNLQTAVSGPDGPFQHGRRGAGIAFSPAGSELPPGCGSARGVIASSHSGGSAIGANGWVGDWFKGATSATASEIQ